MASPPQLGPSLALEPSMESPQILRQRLAIFDFDGTLCSRNSYHVLLQHLLRSGLRRTVVLGCALARRRLGLITSEQLKNRVLAELCGWRRHQVDAWGRGLYEQELRPFLRPAATSEVERLRAEGYFLAVVSGAFDFFLAPFCEEYRIGYCASTKAAFAEGVCLGRLDGPEMRGENKRRILLRHFQGADVDWQQSCAFSDELSDLPLFELVGHPFLVNGPATPNPTSPRLRRVAW